MASSQKVDEMIPIALARLLKSKLSEVKGGRRRSIRNCFRDLGQLSQRHFRSRAPGTMKTRRQSCVHSIKSSFAMHADYTSFFKAPLYSTHTLLANMEDANSLLLDKICSHSVLSRPSLRH